MATNKKKYPRKPRKKPYLEHDQVHAYKHRAPFDRRMIQRYHRLISSLGGYARAGVLTPETRSKIARYANEVRWKAYRDKKSIAQMSEKTKKDIETVTKQAPLAPVDEETARLRKQQWLALQEQLRRGEES